MAKPAGRRDDKSGFPPDRSLAHKPSSSGGCFQEKFGLYGCLPDLFHDTIKPSRRYS